MLHFAFQYNKEGNIAFRIPFLININKLSDYLQGNALQAALMELNLQQLKPFINQVYFEESERNKQGSDYLEKIKEKNPIILMVGDKILNTTLINGNHRAVSAIKGGIKIKGYAAQAKLCSEYGITSDYRKLYESIFNLYENVRGFR